VVFVYLPPEASIGCSTCRTSLQEEEDKVDCVLYEKHLNPFHTSAFCLETAALLFEFSYLVYYDPPDVDTKSGYGKMDLSVMTGLGFKLHSFISDPKSDCQVLIAKKENRVVIAFRGTSSFENVITDLKMKTVEIPRIPKPVMSLQFQQPRAHMGFWEVFELIWPKVEPLIGGLIKEHGESLEFCLTGHSLGKIGINLLGH
jgi:hypothetical protein